MRLGQLLVESSFITQSELTTALAYAQAKMMQIGRCVVVLRMAREEQINLALAAQKHIRAGLDPASAIELLQTANRNKTTFEKTLEVSPDNSVRAYLRESRITAPTGAAKSGGLYDHRPSNLGARTGHSADLGKPVPMLVSQAQDLLKRNNCHEAEELLRAAVERLLIQSDDLASIKALALLAEAQAKLSKFDQLADTVRKVLDLGQKNVNAEERPPAKAVSDLGDTLAALGHYNLAMETYLMAGEMLEQRLPGTLVDAICNLRAASAISKHMPTPQRKKLGELFIASGLINDEQLRAALAHSKQAGMPLGNALEQLKLINPKHLSSVLYCQRIVQQGLLTESVALLALRLAWRQDMALSWFLQGANIPPSQENSPDEKALSDCLDDLLELECSGRGKTIEAAQQCLKLGLLYAKRGTVFDAEHAFRRACGIYKDQPKGSPELVAAALGLANSLMEQARHAEAHALLLQTMPMIPSTPSLDLAEFFDRLSFLELAQGATMSAYNLARSAHAIMDQINCQDVSLRFCIVERLAQCAEEIGDATNEKIFLAKLLEIAKNVPGISQSKLNDITQKLSS